MKVPGNEAVIPEILSRFRYEPETGYVTNRAGKPLGYTTHAGFTCIQFGVKGYQAHRVAWLFTHGEWPKDRIDHINGRRDDNRIANLREAPRLVTKIKPKPRVLAVGLAPSESNEVAVTPYILDNYMPIPESGCWLWMGGWDQTGYGKVNKRGRVHKAHRVFYRALVGEISEGLFVCHKCDTRACVNPQHLFLGTHQDNMADMYNKNQIAKQAIRAALGGESPGNEEVR